jgi:hypothetical protein
VLLKCLSCGQIYIGQTGRDFMTRYKELIKDMRYNEEKSLYTQHILEHSHECDPIGNTIDALKMSHKSKQLDVLERRFTKLLEANRY